MQEKTILSNSNELKFNDLKNHEIKASEKLELLNYLDLNLLKFKDYFSLFSIYKNHVHDLFNTSIFFKYDYCNYVYNNDFEYQSIFKINNCTNANFDFILNNEELKNICKIKSNLIIDSNKITINENNLSLKFYENSSLEVDYGISLKNFFNSNFDNFIKVNKNELINSIEKSLLFTTNDKSKNILESINFKINKNFNTLNVVATNGYYLNVNEINHIFINNNLKTLMNLDNSINFNIHKKQIKTLLKTLKSKLFNNIENVKIFLDIEIKQEESYNYKNDLTELKTIKTIKNIFFELSDMALIKIKPVLGQYPDYKRILPDYLYKQVTFNKIEVLEKLENIRKLHDKKEIHILNIKKETDYKIIFSTDKSSFILVDTPQGKPIWILASQISQPTFSTSLTSRMSYGT